MKPPRLRMFAGPNGSGKSTIKEKISKINPQWLGVYINPDDIEKEIAETGLLDLGHFRVNASKAGIFTSLQTANQLIDKGLATEVSKLRFSKNVISFRDVSLNSYILFPPSLTS